MSDCQFSLLFAFIFLGMVFIYFFFLLLLQTSVLFLSGGSHPCTVIGFPVPIVTQIEDDGQRIPKLRFLALDDGTGI